MTKVQKKIVGKKGPCFHCGIENTPLWRNGPPEKPILCNACGSRWRIWADLTNYTPKHAMPQPPAIIKRRKKVGRKNAKNKKKSDKLKSEEIDNRSSKSGAATVVPDNCNTNGGLWNVYIPRRKRSVLNQYTLSSTGWLHRQLCDLLQDREFSKLSEEPDELLFLPDKRLSSNEIGLGCIRLPSSPSR